MESTCKMENGIDLLRNNNYEVTVTNNQSTTSVKVFLTEDVNIEFLYSDPSLPPDVVFNNFPLHENELQYFKSIPNDDNILEFIQQFDFRKEFSKKNSKSSENFNKKKSSYTNKIKSFDQKKPSMKTSKEVINRILWDSDLETTDFTIGYIDRFLGILEKNFTAFNWEDIASVDYNVLAIPKHRIQYFKYKNKIVWDKTKRIDDVFGSTGSGLNINDVISSYTDVQNEFLPEISTGSPLNNEVTIITGDEILAPKQPTNRPTHFLCQRIFNTEVVNKISDVQSEMLTICPIYEDCAIVPNTLHLTLCTMCLNSNEDLKTMTMILEENKDEIEELSKDLMVGIEGVGQFFDRVIYAPIVANERLNELVNYIKYITNEGGIGISDLYEFIPHVTLFKLKHDSKKKFPTKIMEPFIDTKYGHHEINEICLCEISKVRDDDGFYSCPMKLILK